MTLKLANSMQMELLRDSNENRNGAPWFCLPGELVPILWLLVMLYAFFRKLEHCATNINPSLLIFFCFTEGGLEFIESRHYEEDERLSMNLILYLKNPGMIAISLSFCLMKQFYSFPCVSF